MINCTCRVIQSHGEEGEIEFCPLHEAAEYMYEVLEEIDCFIGDPYSRKLIEKAINKAEGK